MHEAEQRSATVDKCQTAPAQPFGDKNHCVRSEVGSGPKPSTNQG